MAKENQIVSRIVSLAVECVRIEPPAEFGFAWGLEFRRQCQSGSADCAYVLDLRHTRVLDTAALGMLRQLVERAASDPQRLQIIHVSPELCELLEIAGLKPFFRAAER